MIQPIPAGHGGPSYFTEKRLPPLFFDTLLVHKLAAAQANQTVGALPTDVAQCIGQCAQALRHADHEASSPSIWQPGCGLDFNRWANQRIAHACRAIHGLSIRPDQVNLNQSTNDTMPTVIHIGLLRACRQDLQPACRQLIRQFRCKAADFSTCRVMGRTYLRDAKPMALGEVFASWANLAQEHQTWLEQALGALTQLPQGGYSLGNGDGVNAHFAGAYAYHLGAALDIDCTISPTPACEISGIRAIAAFAGALAALSAGLEKIASDAMLLCSGPNHGFGDLLFAESDNDSTTLAGKSNPKPATTMQMVCCYCRAMCGMVVDMAARGQLALYTLFPLTAYALLDSVAVLGDYVMRFAEEFVAALAPNPKEAQRWNA